MWTSHCQWQRVLPKIRLGKWPLWTIGLVLDVALDDEWVNVNYSTDPPMHTGVDISARFHHLARMVQPPSSLFNCCAGSHKSQEILGISCLSHLC